MNDLTRSLLDRSIASAEREARQRSAKAAEHRLLLKGHEESLAAYDQHLRQLMHVRALMTGEAAELAADDIQSADDVLGLYIGGFAFSPPDEATDEELTRYRDATRALYEHAQHQARLAADVLNGRADRTPADGVPVVEPAPAIEAPAAEGRPPIREGTCIHCKGAIIDAGGGAVHTINARGQCYTDRPASPYAQFADPFDVGPDPDPDPEPATEPNVAEAPKEPTAYRVTFERLGRQTDLTPLEIRALDIEHLEQLLAVDAAQILDVAAETLEVVVDDRVEMTGTVLRRSPVGRKKEVGRFAVEVIEP